MLAAASGLHPTYIGAVERGERNPSLGSIEKIARGLNIDLPTLFYFSSDARGKGNLLGEILRTLSQKKRSQILTALRIAKVI